jgi:hypothetical protein
MSVLKSLGFFGGAVSKTYIEDVFSAFTYTGNGSTQSIVNGVDLAGKGGMVWIKSRSDDYGQNLCDTVRGRDKYACGNSNVAQDTGSGSGKDVASFDSTGFTLGAVQLANVNDNLKTFASWSFAQANKFFKVAQVTKSAGSNATVDLSSLGTIGMVTVKRTDSTGDWYTFHRSLTSGKLVYLNKTDAEATLGHITVSGTTLTLVDGVIANGTYIVYAWAHDTGADGLIQCGSFTTDGSGNASVTLGWEPQWLSWKRSDSALGGDWRVSDSARGLGVTAGAGAGNNFALYPNLSMAENMPNNTSVSATGFSVYGLQASSTYIYLAIRRGPMKLPTSGTQVYNAISNTGNDTAKKITGVGFPPDLAISVARETVGQKRDWMDRLRGPLKALYSEVTTAETSETDSLLSFDMDGISLGADQTQGYWNVNQGAPNNHFIEYFFRRAPGVFDIVAYTGTDDGSGTIVHDIPHNLTVPPGLIILKQRDGSTNWPTYNIDLGNTKVSGYLNLTNAASSGATIWNSTSPTSSVFTIMSATFNAGAKLYVVYLFATLSGVSKVFSYTGNGGNVDAAGTGQTINCGFSTGARFVIIKCTSHVSDWVVIDTTRGIAAGDDKVLSLNTTAAEVTATDLIDSDASGFIVNQLATGTTSANFNVTGRTYIGLAFS